jgi:hypothetical protein
VKRILKILGIFTVFFCFSFNTVYVNYPLPRIKCPVSSERPDIIKERSLHLFLYLEKSESSVSLATSSIPTLHNYFHKNFPGICNASQYPEYNPFNHNFYFEEEIEINLCRPDIIYPFHYFF